MASGSVTFVRVARQSGAPWACALALDRLLPLGAVRLWPARVVPAARLADQAGASSGLGPARRARGDHRGEDAVRGPARDRLARHLQAGLLPAAAPQGRLNPSPAIEVVRESGPPRCWTAAAGWDTSPPSWRWSRRSSTARRPESAWWPCATRATSAPPARMRRWRPQRGLIGLATTSTPTPAVVPTFGTEPMLGTNPIALAAPTARNRPFLLDMATSTVSLGKLVERWRGGRRLPRGWALDPRGRPVTSGRTAARHRRLAPLGGEPEGSSHKGYGLAAGGGDPVAVLPGGPAGDRGSEGGGPLLPRPRIPRGSAPRASLAGDLDQLIDSLHRAAAADPERPVLVPGDPEEQVLAERTAAGIPLTRGRVRGHPCGGARFRRAVPARGGRCREAAARQPDGDGAPARAAARAVPAARAARGGARRPRAADRRARRAAPCPTTATCSRATGSTRARSAARTTSTRCRCSTRPPSAPSRSGSCRRRVARGDRWLLT